MHHYMSVHCVVDRTNVIIQTNILQYGLLEHVTGQSDHKSQTIRKFYRQ